MVVIYKQLANRPLHTALTNMYAHNYFGNLLHKCPFCFVFGKSFLTKLMGPDVDIQKSEHIFLLPSAFSGAKDVPSQWQQYQRCQSDIGCIKWQGDSFYSPFDNRNWLKHTHYSNLKAREIVRNGTKWISQGFTVLKHVFNFISLVESILLLLVF